jgi:transcription elongation factor
MIKEKINDILDDLITCNKSFDNARKAILEAVATSEENARIDELNAIESSWGNHSTRTAKSGEVGKWITIDERIEQLGGYDL